MNATQDSVRGFSRPFAMPDGLAEQLVWLGEQRLLGVIDLLAERELISASFATMARPFAHKRGRVSEHQLAEERRVLGAMSAQGVPSLPLKGCLLGYLVYPSPDLRTRSDLDLLVSPDSLAEARTCLQDLGYRLMWDVAGGTPMHQESWLAWPEGHRQCIDLHWRLRNHPVLRDRMTFDEQWSEAVELSGLPGVRGQSPVHALINASMHWFDDIYRDGRPLGWLLDKDLLWRRMNEAERARTVSLAGERGLGGLLAESLRLARAAFDTPVSDEVIAELDAAGRGRLPTRLKHTGEVSALRNWLFALRCEPGTRARLYRLRESLFPPAAHMRQRYPEGSRFGLAGLYWRRIARRI